ncbi:ABC transporter atnG [Colletotrichum sidae]|uniref:ABC transporter atnG n=1 Tax=Colletotrichum sidae TaxID=1347389 RepID=A0A4V3I3Y9_9PEZI|nr:ABC transporter atnG [Colletotrichum sidae]
MVLSTAISVPALKLALLLAESQGKRSLLRSPYDQSAPEETAGVLSRIFFWWINAILAKGYRMILTGDALPPVDGKLSSGLRLQEALLAWDQRAKPETKTTLPGVLIQSMALPFIAPIIPRLILIAFRYAQPLLIGAAIRYLNASSGGKSTTAYMIILKASFVYMGLAISKAIYQHRLNRLKIMIRVAVVGLINNKSLNQPSTGYEDGKAVTLMSTDAENVGQSASMFHEAWAHVIEVLLGTVMLARQVGWVCLLPYALILLASQMSKYLAKNLQGQQKNWTVATQKRLAMTSSMISSMKSLKMQGIISYTESLVQTLRLEELGMAQKVRWMMVAYNASANALGIFSPIITLVLYVLIAQWKGSSLDTETAFTTTALLGLITHPANMIMTIVPQAIGSLAAFERIQQYLLLPPRLDQRRMFKKTDEVSADISFAITLENVTLQPNPSKEPILSNLDLVIDRGSFFMCSGPVGSGKTTLAKAILGELPTAGGTISVSTKRIASCEQSPWLPSGTLESAICGFLPGETGWYEEVVRLCCLEDDFAALPDGDQTQTGSRGLNLSGGQRQRVALARAIYARYEVVILDDSFSALDGKTENLIVENLLGADGYFRRSGTTVILITSSPSHCHLADWLLILGHDSIAYQGTWAGLENKPGNILKHNIYETRREEKQTLVDKTVQSQSLKVTEAIVDLSRATGDTSLYGYYLKAVGFGNFSILLACTATYSLFITFPQYWLQKWTEAPASQTTFYITGYLIISFLSWVATNGSMWSTHILIAPTSGVELHRRLLSIVIGAPLSFFSVTNTGAILNRRVPAQLASQAILMLRRFSQDIQFVDRQLPHDILSMSNQIFKLLVQVALLFSAQRLLAATLPLCVAAVYVVQKIYLRTSRQLRLLDLESRSEVYSNFLESVEGVATIRAFDWEKQVEQTNIRSLDQAQKPDYLLYCLQQWLSIVLDLIVAAMATGLIALAVLMKGTTTAGQIGMALNIVLVANTTLLSLVSSWTNLEISLGAISRLKNLETETPREDKVGEDYVPDEIWPSAGEVELDSVTAAYKPQALALEDINIKISPGQQLIVCGRTGSGKSTLLLTLLRLLDTQSGTIKIDGVDLSLVPRSLVRQRCFVTVGQDALVLGQASLRFNLDPSSSLSDEDIVAALRRTSLWSHFASASSAPSVEEAREVLDRSIADLPQISTGQYQLFSLARAILRLRQLSQTHVEAQIKPILLLDEATSSLDLETEATIRRIIHEEEFRLNFSWVGFIMLQIPIIGLLLGLVANYMLKAQAASLPKQLAVVRRRSGLTHKEYLYYHTLVHGQKAWNAPRDDAFPLAYIQDHVFDGVFGANNSVPNQVFVGRDDVVELYSSAAGTFTSPPPTNYTQTVIGPDGGSFNDFPTAMSIMAYETFLSDLPAGPAQGPKRDDKTGPLVAFLWAVATKDATSNETFANDLASALVKPLPPGVVYNASVHVPVPGADTRPYFGGFGMPTINAVIKLWLNEGGDSISALRSAQTGLDNAKLHLDENQSFMLFSREVVIWDMRSGIDFEPDRLTATLKAGTY